MEKVPLIYSGKNKVGDFGWMIKQPQYNQMLFLFNDNQEQFIAFMKPFMNACTPGGGNAIVRPYQCTDPPRAAGIPTGKGIKGYTDLSEAKPFIDEAFKRINNLLQSGKYTSVGYSAAEDGRSLGTAIFAPSNEVKAYILQKIEEL